MAEVVRFPGRREGGVVLEPLVSKGRVAVLEGVSERTVERWMLLPGFPVERGPGRLVRFAPLRVREWRRRFSSGEELAG